MAKVRINTRAVQANINKRIKQFKSDKKEMNSAGKIIRNEIVADTRKGLGYDGDPFPFLSDKTVDRRYDLSGVNKTHQKFSAAFSNATFTGDTIKKIASIVKGNKIIIFGKGSHKTVKGIKGKTLANSRAKISDILGGLQSKGWKILGVSKRSKERISKQFVRFLRRSRK